MIIALEHWSVINHCTPLKQFNFLKNYIKISNAFFFIKHGRVLYSHMKFGKEMTPMLFLAKRRKKENTTSETSNSIFYIDPFFHTRPWKSFLHKTLHVSITVDHICYKKFQNGLTFFLFIFKDQCGWTTTITHVLLMA